MEEGQEARGEETEEEGCREDAGDQGGDVQGDAGEEDEVGVGGRFWIRS